MPGIVVGVNGSPNSERALDWAMRQAAALHARLTVIAVHEVPKSYWGGIPVIGPADRPLLEKLRQAAEEMTRQAASRLGDAGPASVQVHAVNGFVVKELVDASHDADHGSRRRTRRQRVCPAADGLGEQRGRPALGMPSRDRPPREVNRPAVSHRPG